MPPKSMRGSKEKKGGKERSHNGLNEQKKVAYIVEIQELEKRLSRYQTKHDEILATNNNFQEQLDKMVMEQREGVSFFGKELQRRVDEIADLNDQLVGLQQTKETERERQYNELHQQRNEFKEIKDQLLSKNASFGHELGLLDEYRIHKDDFLRKIVSLEAQVGQLKEMHQQENEHLEWKESNDRDRLKTQMGIRINQVATGFRKSSNMEMAETTKLTIRENVSIQEQVDKMSDKSSELTKENEELRERTRSGRKQIIEMESKNELLTKNYVSSNKVIELLKKETAVQNEELLEYGLDEEQCQQRQIEVDVIMNKRTQNENERSGMIEAIQSLKININDTEEKNKKEDGDINQLKKVLTAAATMLHEAVRSGSEPRINSDVLKRILYLLRHREAVDLLTDSFPTDNSREHRGKSNNEENWPRPPNDDDPSMDDVGYVSSRGRRVRSRCDRTEGGRSSALSTHERGDNLLTKSAATQTVSTQKAIYFCNKVVEGMSLADCEAVLNQSRVFLQENLLPPIEYKRSSNARHF